VLYTIIYQSDDLALSASDNTAGETAPAILQYPFLSFITVSKTLLANSLSSSILFLLPS